MGCGPGQASEYALHWCGVQSKHSITNIMAWFLSRAPAMSCFTLNRAVSVLCSVLYADWYSSCSPFIVRCSVSRWTATFSNTLPMNAMLETGQ